jgi:hypothetical protein
MQPIPFPITDQNGRPIPESGSSACRFYSASGTWLASGYNRVVIGGRGAYLEYAPENMCLENLHIPAGQEWRLQYEKAYYIEHCSSDDANVKVYQQLRRVDYADYQIRMFYIAPADVVYIPDYS